ncbi:MAG: ATPase [Ascidiaceihabitans sp.]|nr:ATPase [Ascidiaceihabitans sp.]
MLYPTKDAWAAAPNKRVMVFGMSGLGKTHMSTILRDTGDWFHYSIDYRIGTRYMGEYIVNSCIKAAMDHPYLREMLRQDAIYLAPNVHTHDLGAVSTYLGKPGDLTLGGLSIEEYKERQDQFRSAEIAALNDTAYFADRGTNLYGYPHFICDTGGSICEWVEATDDSDALMSKLSTNCLPLWIKGNDAHTAELVRRFDKAPKPMAYQPEFLAKSWTEYLNENSISGDKVNPDAFVRWTYARALEHRQPRYEAMARWGVTVTADEVASLKSAADFDALIGHAIVRM